MSDIEWASDPKPRHHKYGPLLADIKSAQLGDDLLREEWAKVAGFAVEPSARDLANRLGKEHDEFDFVSRKGDEETIVYARLKEGVSA